MKKITLLFLLLGFTSLLPAQVINVSGFVHEVGHDPYGNYPVVLTGIGGFTYSDTIYTDVWGDFNATVTGNSSQAGIRMSFVDCNGTLQKDSVFVGGTKYANMYECLQRPKRLDADFTYSANGLTVTFVDQSVPGGIYWPLVYWYWNIGEDSPYTGRDSIKSIVFPDSSTYTHTFSYPGLYYLEQGVDDNIGGNDNSIKTLDLVPPIPSTICGLWEGGDIVDSIETAVFYLITHDPTLGILTAVDTTYSVHTGYFGFNNLPDGTYYIKAAPLPSDPDYATKIPTYYSVFPYETHWQDADSLAVTSTTHVRKDFDFIKGTNPGGPGFIGGLISQGANKGPGDPIEGVSILLFDAQDKPVTHTTTDANGEYSFSNIAYGTYKVHVEVIGKASTDQLVTISAGVPSVTEIDFEVNSKTVDLSTGIDEVTFGTVLQLYPHPTADDLFVELELKAHTSLMISVIDQLGRELKAETHVLGSGEQQVSLSLEELPVGIYLVRLEAEGEAITRRVVKW